jgi:hypothetical protein
MAPQRISCPYCYREIKGGLLWFVCAGRGSPQYPGCAPEPDEQRERLTGFIEPSRPAFPPPEGVARTVRLAACPACYGITGLRACPNCHTVLSPTFGDRNSPLIALVGAIGTGKTVYLTVLAHELRNDLRRRFNADVRLTGDGQGGFRSSVQWLQNNVDRMYRNGELSPLTQSAPGGRRHPLVFEWRQTYKRWRFRERSRSSFLSFYDTAGEDLTNPNAAYEQQYIGAADALIVLLDPFLIPAARDQIKLPDQAVKSNDATVDVLARVTNKLREARGILPDMPITVPVAVVFAKIDAFFDVLGPDHTLRRVPEAGPVYDETLGGQTHEAVKSLLHQWSADDIEAHLRNNYRTYRYFAVSALGTEPNYADLTLQGSVRPHRVDEPLVWLLSQFRVVPKGTRK